MDLQSLVLSAGVIALLYISYKALAFIWFMLRCYVFPSFGYVVDLKKYGEWAVVTGATDGIGKQYARQLAKRGLKVVLISRTEAKLKSVQNEIENEFGVETKIITYDFTHNDGYGAIEEALKELDIGILVNNVGISSGEGRVTFAKQNRNNFMNIVNANAVSDVMMTHIVLEGMLQRKRGAVVHIGSLSTVWDLPLVGLYGSTKAFMRKFFQLLDVEHGEVIHHQFVMAGFISTNRSKVSPSFTIPSAEDFVKSAVHTIGLSSLVCGCWIHELQGVLFSNIRMTRAMNWSVINSLTNTRKKQDSKLE